MYRKNSIAELDATRRDQRAAEFENFLRRQIVGQDEAVEKLAEVYQMFATGLNAPGRPLGNLLFLGPTGSGKTRAVEATAEALFGSAQACIKVDCAEFQQSHEIAKLIGSPPGYLGHRETHARLTQENLNRWHTEKLKISIVLFDEIEKASDSLWQLLLGILDKATLTLGDNRRVDFSQSIIVMTSNLGAREMSNLLKDSLGFARNLNPMDAAFEDKVDRTAVEAARRKFTPEFMNRIDKVVVFKTLRPEHLRTILEIELGQVQKRILAAPGRNKFAFSCSQRVKDFLLEEGTDANYGARYLKRAIERHLVFPLARLVGTGQVGDGDFVRVDLSPESRMTFMREAERVPYEVLIERFNRSGEVMPMSSRAAKPWDSMAALSREA